MPVNVTRSNKVSASLVKSKGPLLPSRKVGPAVVLPTVKSEIVHDLEAYSILIHGEPGIGKTTLATVAHDNTLVLVFDPPQKSLALLQVHCPDWKTFTQYIDALVAKAKAGGTFPYKRIVIDGIERCYNLCQKYTEGILAVDDISDEEWGKGFNQLNKRFSEYIGKLMSLTAQPTNCGTNFICHSVWREVEVRKKGAKLNKLMPLMKGGADREITGLVDCVFAYQYAGTERILVVRGDERTYAKCRINGHFLTPKGEQVIEVPMGKSEREGWANLLSAFNNKQTFTHVRGGNIATAPAGLVAKKPGLLIKRR